MKRQVRLVGDRQREYAKQLIDEAPLGDVMKLGEETRSDEQNRKLHAMLTDYQQQAEPGFSIEDLKLRFMHGLQSEMRFLPDLEERGLFPVGQRTSTLSKSQFSTLIELIYLYGAKRNVRWSRSALDVFEEYGHARKAA